MFGKFEIENEENNRQLKLERDFLVVGIIIGIAIGVAIWL